MKKRICSQNIANWILELTLDYKWQHACATIYRIPVDGINLEKKQDHMKS